MVQLSGQIGLPIHGSYAYLSLTTESPLSALPILSICCPPVLVQDWPTLLLDLWRRPGRRPVREPALVWQTDMVKSAKAPDMSKGPKSGRMVVKVFIIGDEVGIGRPEKVDGGIGLLKIHDDGVFVET